MKDVKIRDVKVFVTAPLNINLVVVKVETTEPELYGYGCATFTWRYKTVVTAVEEYLRPMLIGKSVHNIEDAWQMMMGSSYWRNGPVLNNAISGVDEALWDIKGKIANMPLYNLLGGKSREGIHVYIHADGNSIAEVKENIHQLTEKGFRYVRCHMGIYGGNFNGKNQQIVKPMNAPEGAYYHPKKYIHSTIQLIEAIRSEFGEELEMMHDIHERLSVVDALTLAKELEPYHLFFLEDALPPEQASYYKYLREQTSVAFAMGELFTSPIEWKPLVQNQWIDFIRVHLSDIGGITPAIKLANICELYGVRTAWHGPSDLSPIGMVAQMHLDLKCNNFGVQEFSYFSKEEREVFLGCPDAKDGYVYLSDAPGIGIEFDEVAAAKYPPVDMDFSWMMSRLPDGTSVRP
ncbi:MAG: enolase C-terminal domain-like protein [Eubacteriales bacterium]